MGIWAVQPAWFSQMFSLFQSDRLPVVAIHEADTDSVSPPPYTVEESGVALIHVEGQMIKGESKFGGANNVALRKAVRDASADSAVKAIALRIDSPGGTVAGTQELASSVVAARAGGKPVHAYIEDLGASAAYWVASQAESISMNPLGEAGSIGVYAVVQDTSGRAERLGIKTYVISTGDYKGSFVDGAPVSKEEIAYVQEQVDQVNEVFKAAVVSGRDGRLQDIESVADGRTFIGEKARELGLVDRIESFDEFMSRIVSSVKASEQPRRKKVAAMAKISLD